MLDWCIKTLCWQGLISRGHSQPASHSVRYQNCLQPRIQVIGEAQEWPNLGYCALVVTNDSES